MIASFQFRLAEPFLLVQGEELSDLLTEVEYGGAAVQAIVTAPYQSRLPPLTGTRADARAPADPNLYNAVESPEIDPDVEINGHPAMWADAIAVRLLDVGFDRTIDDGFRARFVELSAAAADAINGVMARIRVLTRATHLRLIDPSEVSYRLVFLDDDGTPVEADEGSIRHTVKHQFSIRQVAVTSGVWESAVALGDYEAPPWAALLLDAQDLKTEIGPCLVLAQAAVETRIAHALDVLSKGQVDGALWEWLTTRGDDYRLTPSVSEELDEVLTGLGARSLKTNPELWEAWQHLRQARNSFVHEGCAMIGKRKKKRTPVSRERARELAVRARDIISFIEEQLPAGYRWPTLDVPVSVTTSVVVMAPDAVGKPPEEAN